MSISSFALSKRTDCVKQGLSWHNLSSFKAQNLRFQVLVGKILVPKKDVDVILVVSSFLCLVYGVVGILNCECCN